MDFDIIEGSGKYIFFLHGWGGDKNSFAVMKNHIAEINRSMVFVSFVGFGKTCEPQTPYSLDYYVDDLVSLIVKIAKGKSVDIVCHSFGARVAILLAYKYPLIVNKIMIVDGAGMKPKRKISYYINVAKFKSLKKKVQVGKADKSELERYGSPDYRKLSDVMKKTFTLIVNRNLEKEAGKIKTQTLLFWGKKDVETPLYMAKRFKRLLKNSSLIISENSGHFSYLDDFELFFKHFKDFML